MVDGEDGEDEDPEPVPEEVTDRTRATAPLSGASSGDSHGQQSGETVDVLRQLKGETNAESNVSEKKDGRSTVEVLHVKYVDEVIRAPVVARRSKENKLNEVSDLRCGRGERSVNRKDSRPRFMCGDLGSVLLVKSKGLEAGNQGLRWNKDLVQVLPVIHEVRAQSKFGSGGKDEVGRWTWADT